MKMRMRPLRGQIYETVEGHLVTFVTRKANQYEVIWDDKMELIHMAELVLPIIDTKDYEKIEDTKYKGD